MPRRKPADTATVPPVKRPSARRRLAAAGALVALVAAGVVAGWSLVRYPVQLPVAVLLIMLAVVAGWTALVHHGIRRVLAGIAASMLLVATVLLPGVHSFMLIAVVAGLVVVSSAAARVAIARDLAPATQVRSVGPAKHARLLMNPWSGGGKVEHFGLEEKARELGIIPIVLHRGDDLRALAERAVAEGADVIGMAGGDGSQALVADVARQHDIPFVCIPAGTRNHFALDLGLDRTDVAASLAAFGAALERRVDLALLGDRVFVNNASLGVYAKVVQSEDYRDAKLATIAQLLPDLLGPDAPHFDLRLTRPDGTSVRAVDTVLVSNGAYRLHSLNGFGTRSRLDAGVLGVVTVAVDRTRGLRALMSAQAAGHIDQFRGYQEWTTGELAIDSGQPLVDVGLDGEALRLPPPLRFRSLPGALRVRTPLGTPNAAPAAVAPFDVRQAVAALFRVLAGHPAG